jgi:hypothetical protein
MAQMQIAVALRFDDCAVGCPIAVMGPVSAAKKLLAIG